MSRKILFFDVDGTLIHRRTHEYPESTISAINRARSLGHLVFINTGRVLCLVDMIKEKMDVDGYVLGCGTQITIGDKVIYEKRIDRDRGIELKEDLIKTNTLGLLEAQQGIYFPAMPFNSEIMDYNYQMLSAICPTYQDSFHDHSYDFDKFCLQSREGKAYEDVYSFKKYAEDFEFIVHSGGFFECVPLSCSKGSGLEKVLDYYDISADDAYVFGDSRNDITMFQSKAKHKIIMGEHDSALEEYATFTTKNVEEHGIYYAMKSLDLI